MKKSVYILLVLVFCMSLFACGAQTEAESPTGTMDQVDLSTAPMLDLEAYSALYAQDPAQACEAYEGQYFRCSGQIVSIDSEACYFGYQEFDARMDLYVTHYTLRICPDSDVLEGLEVGQTCTFGGMLVRGTALAELQNAEPVEP